jgi:hypothetical protein
MKNPRLKLLPPALLLLISNQLMALPVSYENPPEYLQYIEGEEAFEHNWTPGESRHFWWRNYAKVTGRGVLELAATSLPEGGAFVASYRFDVPESGTYCIYARTRLPGFLASPFSWSIDGGAERRQPADDRNIQENIVAEVLNKKMALVRLGPFEATKGTHTLRVAVREFVTDGKPYLSQAIDALALSRCAVEPFPKSRPVAAAGVTLNANVDPAGAGYPGSDIPLALNDWSHYSRLVVPIQVESRSTEPFEGRLRVYREGGGFVDLPVSVPAAKFGSGEERAFDLSSLFAKGEAPRVTGLRIHTHDKWYAAPHAYSIKLGEPRLEGKTADAPANLVVEPRTGVPAPAAKDARKGDGGAFVWNDVSNTGGSAGVGSEQKPDQVSVRHADGKERAAEVEFLSQPGGGTAAGEQRMQFKLTNKSDSDIYRVDFGFQGPHHAGKGWFLAGSARYDVKKMPASESLLGPSRFTHDWVCITADGRTLYSYLEDPAHQDSSLQFKRDDSGGISWCFSKFTRIKAGESWTSPVVVVGNSDGEDWHPSADKFSQWWFSWASSPKVPEWFRGIGGMEVGLKYPENGRTTDIESRRKTDLESLEGRNTQAEGRKAGNRKILADVRERTGIDWWHSGGWLPLGTEAWYPEGYLLNERQTKDLLELTDDVRAAGGRTSFYSNPLMLSRVAPQYADLKDRWVVMDADGYPVYTEHTFRHHPMALAVADREWGKKFAEFVLPLVRDARPDALYMDQLGAVPIHLDWTKGIPASRLGFWSFNQGLFCEAVMEELRGVNPDLVTGIEGVNVYAQQYVTYSLLFDGDYSILKYTFPSYTTMVGQYEEVDAARVVRNAEQALLTGQPLILINDPAKLPDDAARRIKEIVGLKRSLDPVLYTLRFRDTVGLRVDEGVDAGCFVGEKGVKVIVAVNRSKERKSITIGDGSLEIVRKWGAEQTTLSEGNILQLPPESLSAVELKEKR